MQQQRRLQHIGENVPPVNRAIERIQLAGKVERAERKRNQAKNVKVSRSGSSPAPEQDVKSNAQINQADQPQPIVEGVFLSRKNWSRVKYGRAPL